MLIMILELSSLISDVKISDVKKIEGVAISSPPLYHWQDQAELSMRPQERGFALLNVVLENKM